jgi:hypothetical protein
VKEENEENEENETNAEGATIGHIFFLLLISGKEEQPNKVKESNLAYSFALNLFGRMNELLFFIVIKYSSFPQVFLQSRPPSCLLHRQTPFASPAKVQHICLLT